MALTDPFQGHIDVALSNFALKHRNTQLLADLIFPRVGVNRQSDKFFIFGRENLLSDADDVRAAAAGAKRISHTLSDALYNCPDHSLADAIPIEDQPKPGMPSRRERATRTITDRLLLNHDVRTADLVSSPATYPAANKVQLTGTDQWSDAGSDPVLDVQTSQDAIVKAIGIVPNTLILGREVFSIVRNHANIVSRVQNVKLGSVSVEDLAAIFDVVRVLVWRTIKRSQAGVNSFVFGKHAVLAHIQDNPSPEDVSFGKTFVWQAAPGTVGGMGTELGPLSPPSARAEEVSVHFYHDEQVTSSESGYLIEDAVA